MCFIFTIWVKLFLICTMVKYFIQFLFVFSFNHSIF